MVRGTGMGLSRNVSPDCWEPCPNSSNSIWAKLEHTRTSGRRSGARGCDSPASQWLTELLQILRFFIVLLELEPRLSSSGLFSFCFSSAFCLRWLEKTATEQLYTCLLTHSMCLVSSRLLLLPFSGQVVTNVFALSVTSQNSLPPDQYLNYKQFFFLSLPIFGCKCFGYLSSSSHG